MTRIMIGINWKEFFEQWKDVEIYNPHCIYWNQCESDDCFMCTFNLKGSEQYVLEKLIDKVIKSIENEEVE